MVHDDDLGSRIHASTTLLEAQKDGAEHGLILDDKVDTLHEKIYGIQILVGAGAITMYGIPLLSYLVRLVIPK